MNHTIIMLLACFFAGWASTMNVWADRWDDVYLHMNDLYMVGLMTGWMFFFMGLFEWNMNKMIFGGLAAALFFYFIRNQTLITERQYLRGMIPHHSMAVLMSKRLSNSSIQPLLDSIIENQEKEIILMKRYLNEYPINI